MAETAGPVITIDGPSGVGKSTISRRVAAHYGFTYLDTGAMYRAVAWYLLKHAIDIEDVGAVESVLDQITITLLPTEREDDDVGVLVNGNNISDQIRTPDISMVASTVSALPAVRKKLTTLQRQIGSRGCVVAEGRDTGTVVFPGATNKFYLDASPEARTARRAQQLRERGKPVDEEQLLEMTIVRDRQDSERLIAPLIKADDAVLIDTTELDVDQVFEAIRKLID
ncbi:MAG: (d)CMP kinase [Desulfofustis sp.]|nr:(d)CMP kinase [Desulfofustis sp.]NNK56609.1 (d)CMP kinase [Desulfofustis sp.]